MPDDQPGQTVAEETAQNVPPPQLVDSPTPPNNPTPQPAQGIPDNGVSGTVKNIENSVKRAERWMIGLTAGIVFLTLGLVVASFLQWNVMSGQLQEMRSSGATSTDQVWRAISNMNWMARTADGSLHQTREAMGASAEQSRALLTSSTEALFRELRPYVVVRAVRLVGEIENDKKFHGTAEIFNTGRTPALDTEVCGDIFVTPWNNPITDDHPCPSPGNPKRTPESENSVFVLGSGVTGDVSSPGTAISIAPAGLFPLLANHTFRLYFYGYVSYRDTIKKSLHLTTFCSMYGTESKMWTTCEKHNRMD